MKIGKITLFIGSILIALTTGRAFWAWLGENPSDFSGAALVEFYQVLNRVITVPIALMGAGAIIMSGISAALFRHYRPAFYCLIGATVFSILAAVITIFVHLPINSQLASWNPSALPVNYLEILQQWRTWNAARLILLFIAMSFTFCAMIIDKNSDHFGGK